MKDDLIKINDNPIVNKKRTVQIFEQSFKSS